MPTLHSFKESRVKRNIPIIGSFGLLIGLSFLLSSCFTKGDGYEIVIDKCEAHMAKVSGVYASGGKHSGTYFIVNHQEKEYRVPFKKSTYSQIPPEALVHLITYKEIVSGISWTRVVPYNHSCPKDIDELSEHHYGIYSTMMDLRTGKITD